MLNGKYQLPIDVEAMEDSTVSLVYVAINNIPADYHAADLRNFFSNIVETAGFDCFHYRHRPEVRRQCKSAGDEDASAANRKDDGGRDLPRALTESAEHDPRKTCCCVVRLSRAKANELARTYHRKHWLDSSVSTPKRGQCFVSRIAAHRPLAGQLAHMPELHPPALMPNGNVGTPTAVFLDSIRTCKLPSSIIKKLGLAFPTQTSRRIYGSVYYDYGGSASAAKRPRSRPTGDDEARRHRLEDSPERSEDDDDDESGNDDDGCEEWERHEAFHDDVDQQGRTSERLFEEEIELQWEKGGSGLVFYTDAQRWDADEGDFDERTADDWDVDTSVYYEKGAGDADSRDFVAMRREGRRRAGRDDGSVFEKSIGKFERHTKGIGRKVMERQGWREGDGLGRSTIGMAVALENEGQHPRDKKGFGYHGEKLKRGVVHHPKRNVIISTIYDRPKITDPPEPLLRSNLPTTLKTNERVRLRSS